MRYGWKWTHVEILSEIVVAARCQDALQDIFAPAEEWSTGNQYRDDPADEGQEAGLEVGQLGSVETIADNVVPVEGDHAEQPDAGRASNSTCG